MEVMTGELHPVIGELLLIGIPARTRMVREAHQILEASREERVASSVEKKDTCLEIVLKVVVVAIAARDASSAEKKDTCLETVLKVVERVVLSAEKKATFPETAPKAAVVLKEALVGARNVSNAEKKDISPGSVPMKEAQKVGIIFLFV